MIEKGYKGGLVSRIKNKHSGKRYVVSTAQEIGKDYWTTVVAPSKFFGLWMDFKSRITWVRNSREEAHAVHTALKRVVSDLPEELWLESAPSPKPPGVFSKDVKETFKRTLGYPPEEIDEMLKNEPAKTALTRKISEKAGLDLNGDFWQRLLKDKGENSDRKG